MVYLSALGACWNEYGKLAHYCLCKKIDGLNSPRNLKSFPNPFANIIVTKLTLFTPTPKIISPKIHPQSLV